MNKYWLWVAVVVTGVGVAGYKPISNAIRYTPVDKTVEFSIFKDRKYTSKVYENTTLDIHIVVERINNHQRTVVWDTVMSPKLLRKYPDELKAFKKSLVVPGVVEKGISIPFLYNKKEKVHVTYVLNYLSNGNRLQIEGGSQVSDEKETIEISI